MSDRERWNQRYQAGDRRPLPDEWVVAHTQAIMPSHQGVRALDLACGAGRHVFWLAELGYSVDAWDISDAGLEILQRELARRQNAGQALRVSPRQVDLESASLSANTYDLVLDVFYLERRLFPEIVKALRPNGLLVVRTLMRRELAEDRNTAYLLEPGELRATFADLEILDEDEDPNAGLAGLVARKTQIRARTWSPYSRRA